MFFQQHSTKTIIICICYAKRWAHFNVEAVKIHSHNSVHIVQQKFSSPIDYLGLLILTHTVCPYIQYDLRVWVSIIIIRCTCFPISAHSFRTTEKLHKVKPISVNENWLQMICRHQSHIQTNKIHTFTFASLALVMISNGNAVFQPFYKFVFICLQFRLIEIKRRIASKYKTLTLSNSFTHTKNRKLIKYFMKSTHTHKEAGNHQCFGLLPTTRFTRKFFFLMRLNTVYLDNVSVAGCLQQ